MGCDYGSTLFIGVKLLSKDELFNEVEETRFGCEHKVADSKFCPECGRQGQYKVKRDVPKLEMDEEWWCYSTDPAIDGRFYVNANLEYKPYDVYVGVYSEMEYVREGTIVLTAEEILKYLKEAEDMIAFLNEHNIRFEGDGPSVFVIPYISC